MANPTPFIAAGGIENTFTSGGLIYKSHTFISGSGIFTVSSGQIGAQVLVVGGGGIGGLGDTTIKVVTGSFRTFGSGGGGGGVVFSGSYLLRTDLETNQPSIFDIVVASGSLTSSIVSPYNNTSSITIRKRYEQANPIIAYGGGNNVYDQNTDGASGGGGGYAIFGDQGHDGLLTFRIATGGGGSGTSPVEGDNNIDSAGGSGSYFSLRNGTGTWYGGGGGAGSFAGNSPPTVVYNVPTNVGGGGNGGVSSSMNGSPGSSNTGGGGGGGFAGPPSVVYSGSVYTPGSGSNGGSGIVVITYQLLPPNLSRTNTGGTLNYNTNINLTSGPTRRATPFTARGGIVATFDSGSVNYTSHTFISGSGTFSILSGETQAQV